MANWQYIPLGHIKRRGVAIRVGVVFKQYCVFIGYLQTHVLQAQSVYQGIGSLYIIIMQTVTNLTPGKVMVT